MATCLNCKRKLSCGCQKRKASNGVSCCASCITVYEKAIKATNAKKESAKTNTNVTPGIVGVKITQTS